MRRYKARALAMDQSVILMIARAPQDNGPRQRYRMLDQGSEIFWSGILRSASL